jgi:hypothetical protein
VYSWRKHSESNTSANLPNDVTLISSDIFSVCRFRIRMATLPADKRRSVSGRF